VLDHGNRVAKISNVPVLLSEQAGLPIERRPAARLSVGMIITDNRPSFKSIDENETNYFATGNSIYGGGPRGSC
jgi:hypothetical protein